MRWLAAFAVCLLASACTAPPIPAGGTIEVAFTPWDDAEGALLKVISGARKVIRVQTYLLTSRSLAQGLIDAHRRGVDVVVMADRDMVVKGENSLVPQLAEAGIPVWLEVRYAAAHNKILLADPDSDGAVVVTGSYNFTYSAQARNAENLLIVRGNVPLARAYLDNWQRHRTEAVAWAEIKERR